MSRLTKGAGETDTVFIAAIVILLILSWIHLGATRSTRGVSNLSPFSVATPSSSSRSTQPYNSGSNSTLDGTKSPWYGLVTIDLGSAPSEYEPYQEYIILHASGDLQKSINVSGWQLSNAKGAKVYQVGSNVTRFQSDVATIPLAVPLYIPGKGSIASPVILAPNGQVIVISGSNTTAGGVLPSFRENKCTAYLTHDKKNPVTIYPSVYSYCPAPYKEAGVSGLDNACNTFVSNLNSCSTPDFVNSVRTNGYLEPGYVDTVGGLSQSCKTYIQNHYSYNGCVASHSGDSDFYGSTWHVYLGRKWEMWATERETVTLLDADGKIVNTYSY